MSSGDQWTLHAGRAIITGHETLAESSAGFFGRLGLSARDLRCGFGISEVRLRPQRGYPAERHHHPARVFACTDAVASHPRHRRLFRRRRCGNLAALLAVPRLAVGRRLGVFWFSTRPSIARSNCAI